MKTKTFLTAFVAISLLRQTGASPTDEQRLAAANDIFAFKLLKQIADDQPAANIFISPYSASTALQMVANGAAGLTKAEMQKVLATDTRSTGLPEAALNQADKEIAQSLHDGNTNVVLEMANAIWYRRGSPVKPEFIACNREFFGCTLGTFNLYDPHPEDVINAWASNQTHGKIKRIADEKMFSVDTPRLFLVNAVYFKGRWSDPFDAGDTRNRTFFLQDGSQRTVAMMTKSKTFTCRRGTDYQAVRLPYKGENLAMYVFLPDTHSSPGKLLGLMSGDTWRRVVRPGFSEQAGTLVLPKFKLEYGVELAQPLKELGMKSAFDERADFSGVGPGIGLYAVRQKTFVEVEEEGTEAAAATVAAMGDEIARMPPPNPFQMIVNRPFLFLIEDNRTGMILFAGAVYDPPADN